MRHKDCCCEHGPAEVAASQRQLDSLLRCPPRALPTECEEAPPAARGGVTTATIQQHRRRKSIRNHQQKKSGGGVPTNGRAPLAAPACRARPSLLLLLLLPAVRPE